MTVSLRQLIGAVVVSFCVGALVMPVWTQGQTTSQSQQGTAGANTAPAATPGQPTFMMVEFMKVAEGKESDWLKLERETWKPIHTLRIKEGGVKSWAAIAQVIPGDASEGPVVATVTTYRGWPDITKDIADIVKKAHPNVQPDTIFEQAETVRKIVRTEIWQVLEQTESAGMGTK
jgi:hypothetical protein